MLISKIRGLKTFIKKLAKAIPPPLIVSAVSLLVSAILWLDSPKPFGDPHRQENAVSPKDQGNLKTSETTKPKVEVLGSKVSLVLSGASPTTPPAEDENQNQAAPGPTSVPTPEPSATPTPTPESETVTLRIEAPAGAVNLTLPLSNDNVCDLLLRARMEGKINSVTLDDSYLPTLKSAYVVEINGYRNNWTFTVNGQSPRGCSLYQPKSGDVVVWKFN